MQILAIKEHENFDSMVKEIVSSSNGLVLLYFYGSELEGTDTSFCKDCNDAWPVLVDFLNLQPISLTLVKVAVGSKGSWRSLENFYRLHPQLQLKRIPTLIYCTTQGISSHHRLIEHDCKNKVKIREFLNTLPCTT